MEKMKKKIAIVLFNLGGPDKLENVEPSTSAELNDFFTFEVPGFKYMPAYKNKMWDGKIRLLKESGPP